VKVHTDQKSDWTEGVQSHDIQGGAFTGSLVFS